MRRQKSSISSKVKVLTAGAVVAALATGTINVYAAEGIRRIAVDMGAGNFRYLNVSDLSTNEDFRNKVFTAFRTGQSVLASDFASGEGDYWREISLAVTRQMFAEEREHEELVPPYLPYELE